MERRGKRTRDRRTEPSPGFSAAARRFFSSRGRPFASNRTRALFLAGVCVTLALGSVATARVFLLDPAPPGGPELRRPGWSRVYAADLRVNGRAGQLEVFGVDESLRDACAVLRRAYQALRMNVQVAGSGELAWGLAVDETRVIRLLIAAVVPGRECLVFRIVQTPEAFRASLDRPREHRLSRIPPPPGGRARFCAENEHAGLKLEISDCPRSARDLAGYYDAALAADGWTALTPGSRAGANGGWIYARDNWIAVIQATETDSGETCVIRLVRRRNGGENIAGGPGLR